MKMGMLVVLVMGLSVTCTTACAAMPNAIWPKEPKSSVTVCVRPYKSEPYPGL